MGAELMPTRAWPSVVEVLALEIQAVTGAQLLKPKEP